MNKEEKNILVNIINDEIVKLTTKIAELKEFTAPVSPDNSIGRISRMDAINNKSIYDASLRNTQNRLSQLNEILKLKDDDAFGVCMKCHQPIPFERLKLRPEIRLCATCLNKR
ncbi:MAG: TraR/DksA family transcriptional regulator [Bacteroidetes bacterium]|jgi:DnaK suppressor protein|nr:TraR/DksA family transcriptional regulator [Bacteroidota bacterium]